MITTHPPPARPAARGRGSASRPQRPRRRGRPKLRVVRPHRRPRLPFLVVSLLIVGVLIAAVAGVQAVVSQSSFRMQDLSNRTQELQQQSGELRLEIAELSSPKHLEQAARHLGLQEPDPAHVTVLAVKPEGGRP